MRIKHSIKSLLLVVSTFTAANAYAGNEGVSFYYGAGLGALSIDEKTGFTSHDTNVFADVFFGFEEDGWAFEAAVFRTPEADTDTTNLEYEMDGHYISLGYRTLERNNRYYNITYGLLDSEYDAITPTGTTTLETDGNMVTLGIGFRTAKDKRIELDYILHDPDEPTVASKVHIVTLRFLFGGSKGPNEFR